MELTANRAPVRARNIAASTLKGSRKKHRLLTRDQLDGRTNAAKVFDRLVTNIEADLGGSDQCSTIERALVEAFAGAYVSLANLNTRLALGEPIDLSQHAQCVGAMVRVASRLGLQRRAKEVGGGLGDLMREAARLTSDDGGSEEGQSSEEDVK